MKKERKKKKNLMDAWKDERHGHFKAFIRERKQKKGSPCGK